MRSIKFYVSVFMVIGLISLSSVSFAEERYNIDVDSVKQAAQINFWDGKANINWDAKIKNNTNDPKAYEIKVNFLNSKKESIFESKKVANLNPNEEKVVAQVFNIEASKMKEIDSGYATISEAGKQTLTAKLDKDLDLKIRWLTDELVSVDYTVKLKNNTDKSVTRDVTVAFLDENNNWIKGETKKTSFNAGESKMITSTVRLRTFDADRITTGYVTIN